MSFDLCLYFYPRSPCGERLLCAALDAVCNYFYPRSPCGERPLKLCQFKVVVIFLSTLSLRRATQRRGGAFPPSGISIHALLAESDRARYMEGLTAEISIHALLAESDHSKLKKPFMASMISIHALLAESDGQLVARLVHVRLFLSTLSLRRATDLFHVCTSLVVFLSTLSLRRATPTPTLWCAVHVFLSTLSLRRATPPLRCNNRDLTISIHALLAESDNFLPVVKRVAQISIHALLAESDRTVAHVALCGYISIHALLAESDCTVSMPPCTDPSISIHALLAESDIEPPKLKTLNRIFLSTLSLRRATSLTLYAPSSALFLSTLSLRRATSRLMLECR